MIKTLKKSIAIILIIISALFLFMGCGHDQTKNSSDRSELSSAAVINKDINSMIQTSGSVHSEVSSKTQTEQTKTYFGTWIVKQQIPLPREIGNLTASEAQNIIGMKLQIQKDKFTSLDGETLDTPLYYESNINDTAFYTEWRFHLKEVNISSNSVTEVIVCKTAPTDGYFDNSLGGGFFGIIDNDTLYVNIRGQFFKLERA
jgi:hypothetical protein